MSNLFVPSTALDSRFPLGVQTLYNYKSTGRVDWLIRRGQLLWINIRGYNTWAHAQGKAHRLLENHPQAVALQVEAPARQDEKGHCASPKWT